MTVSAVSTNACVWIGVGDMSALLAKAVGMTLAKHPLMNAAYVQDGIKCKLPMARTSNAA